MNADEFEDRVARLEEHLLEPTAEDHLRQAEEWLARANDPTANRDVCETAARHSVMLAKLARRLEERDDAA